MTRIIRTSSYALAPLFLSLWAFTPAPAQRITGTVQSVLEVPMASGRLQVKKAMPYLSHASIRPQ